MVHSNHLINAHTVQLLINFTTLYILPICIPLSVHKRFSQLAPDKIKKYGRNPILSKEELLRLPELIVSRNSEINLWKT